METEIVSAIAKKLHTVFGDKVRVYDDTVEQGLVPPCFLIWMQEGSQTALPSHRYRRESGYDVRYFPTEQDCRRELCEMADALTQALEVIALPDGGSLRGVKMHWETGDGGDMRGGLRRESGSGVLHFFVSYPHFLQLEITTETMEELHTRVQCG